MFRLSLARLAPVLAAGAALALPSAGQAGARADAAAAERGLATAVRAGRLSEVDADRCRQGLRLARATLPALRGSRHAALASVLRTVAGQAGRYDRARATSLFSTLELNARYLRGHPLPPRGRDVLDADGVVHRSFGTAGLRFHPLASFGRLNALAERRRFRPATRLAFALLARARDGEGGLAWESFLRTSGGVPPWTSGLTQAVAAQALARVGQPREARLAFAAIRPRLLLGTVGGPWIRLYHFSRDLVLNAQLQAALSLEEYGRRTKDRSARDLARALRASAAAALRRFDTGSWSRYSLRGPEASLTYHTYVTSLLWKLARATGNPIWRRYAARFRRDRREPPRVTAPRSGPVVYPVPADGHRDRALIPVLLSKPAAVSLAIAGTTRTTWLAAGAHTLTWEPGPRPPGSYAVVVTARDRAGNVRRARLPDVRIARDTTPPRIPTARVAVGTVRWRVADEETPWIDVRVVARRGGRNVVRDVRVPPGAGATELRLDLGRTWHLTVVARDSSGNRAVRVVGRIGGLDRVPAGTTPA